MIRFLCPQLVGRDVAAPDFDGGGHTIGYAEDRAAVLVCHVDGGGCGARLVADPADQGEESDGAH